MHSKNGPINIIIDLINIVHWTMEEKLELFVIRHWRYVYISKTADFNITPLKMQFSKCILGLPCYNSYWVTNVNHVHSALQGRSVLLSFE